MSGKATVLTATQKVGALHEETGGQTQVTQELCAYLAGLRYDAVPASVAHQACRGVLDWLGCALAGSNHPTIDKLVDVLQELGGKPQATVFGRKLKLGLLDAPLANGQIGHVLDYDDTHMVDTTLVHTSSPILAALFAMASREAVSGERLLLAYAAGFDAAIRTGRATPGHLKGGWHLTGTLGSIAAGVACGKLLNLNAHQLTHALAISATQAAGMQQNRGTMCKSFHAGKAAANGVLAGLLAQRGFDSSLQIIEGKLGFSRIYSDAARPEELTAELGQRWEIARNGYKPYACGVVLHPPIDAVIAARVQAPVVPAQVSAIELWVHPHAVSVTGAVAPATGLQSKFSIYHSAAVAYIDGAARIPQYTDERARDPAVIALREKVKVTIDESYRKGQARAVVTAGGKRCEAVIEHASGTADNPMNDAAIEAKFLANAEPVIGKDSAQRVADLVWKMDKIKDVNEIVALCA